MEQSPFWETGSPSAGKDILRLLWNPKVHCRVHMSPLFDPILSQMKTVHILTPYF
jgi:hypothetical protein